MISNREKSLLAREGDQERTPYHRHYASATRLVQDSINFCIDAGISPRQENASATLGATVGGVFFVPDRAPNLSASRYNFRICANHESILRMG